MVSRHKATHDPAFRMYTRPLQREYLSESDSTHDLLSDRRFGDMLVLAEAYLSWLHPYIDSERFFSLLNRTIQLHYDLQPLSEVFVKHYRVLQQAMEECRRFESERAGGLRSEGQTDAIHPPGARRA